MVRNNVLLNTNIYQRYFLVFYIIIIINLPKYIYLVNVVSKTSHILYEIVK